MSLSAYPPFKRTDKINTAISVSFSVPATRPDSLIEYVLKNYMRIFHNHFVRVIEISWESVRSLASSISSVFLLPHPYKPVHKKAHTKKHESIFFIKSISFFSSLSFDICVIIFFASCWNRSAVFFVHRRKLSDLSGYHCCYIVNGKRVLLLLRQCVPHGLEHSGGHSFPRLFSVINVFLNIPQDSKGTHF